MLCINYNYVTSAVTHQYAISIWGPIFDLNQQGYY